MRDETHMGQRVARYAVTDVKLDPAEVVDRIEDMLSWEAVAGEGQRIAFSWDDFLRADPNVSLGAHATGRITPHGVVGTDDSQFMSLEPSERLAASVGDNAVCAAVFGKGMAHALAKLGERLSYAWVDEVEPGGLVVAKCDRGDNVADCAGDYQGEWRNVRYHVHAFFEMPKSRADQWRRVHKLPQVARVFAHEHVLAFSDGRSASGIEAYGHWGGRFWYVDKRPVARDFDVDGHAVRYDVAAEIAASAWACQLERRDEWTVELALSPERTGVGVPTDAEGAREFVNLLRAGDVTTRRGRKAALVHWVSSHMRRRSGKQDEHLVREHMRGRQTLAAGRYAVRIWPSRSDIQRACNGARFDLAMSDKAGWSK